jgi:hypothetical protein
MTLCGGNGSLRVCRPGSFTMRLFMLASLLALSALASYQPPAHSEEVIIRERLLSIRLDSQHVNAEAYYNGSSFSGGGIMSCLAKYRITVRDTITGVTRRYEEERNVSLQANWSSSHPEIYPYAQYPDQTLNDFVYDAPDGSPDGLWIYGGDSTNIGTTTITVTFGGKTATGSVTFWAD